MKTLEYVLLFIINAVILLFFYPYREKNKQMNKNQ